MAEKDGGPASEAARRCRKCGTSFDPKSWQLLKADYECPHCKRHRQNAANNADPLFREKHRRRNAQPHVRAYLAAYRKKRMATDPQFGVIRAARRKVATEIEAGRLTRKPCEVCGNPRSEAHHGDYAKPLDVHWLCRRHHVEADRAKELADAMLAARK